jgi:myo-inositol-1(or 4)-monophosphatase
MNDLELALTVAHTGAEIVRSGFGAHRTTEHKGRGNPVTEVDHAAEAAIVNGLNEHRPADGLLGEEGSIRHSGGRRWIIDPLDGTVNFVHGVPHVAVSVALYDGDSPLVGVVIDAIQGDVFAAAVGQGATRDGQPISVSDVRELGQSLIATGFPYDRYQHADAYAKTVAAVLRQANGIRRLGSAALDACWVASGRFDAYWEYMLAPWDCAAGVLIAAEAGAVITDGLGRPFSLESRHLVAANPHIHTKLQEIIAGTLPPHTLD